MNRQLLIGAFLTLFVGAHVEGRFLEGSNGRRLNQVVRASSSAFASVSGGGKSEHSVSTTVIDGSATTSSSSYSTGTGSGYTNSSGSGSNGGGWFNWFFGGNRQTESAEKQEESPFIFSESTTDADPEYSETSASAGSAGLDSESSGFVSKSAGSDEESSGFPPESDSETTAVSARAQEGEEGTQPLVDDRDYDWLVKQKTPAGSTPAGSASATGTTVGSGSVVGSVSASGSGSGSVTTTGYTTAQTVSSSSSGNVGREEGELPAYCNSSAFERMPEIMKRRCKKDL